jgi:hypothetical protein
MVDRPLKVRSSLRTDQVNELFDPSGPNSDRVTCWRKIIPPIFARVILLILMEPTATEAATSCLATRVSLYLPSGIKPYRAAAGRVGIQALVHLYSQT